MLLECSSVDFDPQDPHEETLCKRPHLAKTRDSQGNVQKSEVLN